MLRLPRHLLAAQAGLLSRPEWPSVKYRSTPASWSQYGATLAYFLSPCCCGGARGGILRATLAPRSSTRLRTAHTHPPLQITTWCLPVDVRQTPQAASRLRGGDAVATGQLQARSACMTARADGNMDATVATHDLNFSYPGIGACTGRRRSRLTSCGLPVRIWRSASAWQERAGCKSSPVSGQGCRPLSLC